MKKLIKQMSDLLFEDNVIIPDITLNANSELDIDSMTISNIHFRRKLMYDYSDMYMFIFTTVDDTFHVSGAFTDLFNTFVYENQDNFNRIYWGLYSKYNPIENYNKIGDISEVIEYKGTELHAVSSSGSSDHDTVYQDGGDGIDSEVSFEISGTHTNNTAKIGNETNTETLATKHFISTNFKEENSVSAFDSSNDYVNSDKNLKYGLPLDNYTQDQGTITNSLQYTNRGDNTTEGWNNYKETTKESRYHKEEVDDSFTSGTTDQKTFTGRKDEKEISDNTHGNIGVMSNQQMIQQEMDIRLKYNMLDIILNQFVHEFLFRV